MLDKRYIRLIIFASLQLIIAIIYGTCTHLPSRYRTECFTDSSTHHCFPTIERTVDAPFRNYNLALFGFGILYSMMKDHSFASVPMIILGYFIIVEWGFLTMSFFFQCFRTKPKEEKRFFDIKVTEDNLFEISAGPAAAIYISYGALIGTINIPQFIVMIFIECILFSFNYYLCMSPKNMYISDIGGIISIHTFAAFFGAACTFILNKNKSEKKIQPNLVSGFVAIFAAYQLWSNYKGGINWNGEEVNTPVADVRRHEYRIHTSNVYPTTYNYSVIGSVVGLFGINLFFNKGALKPEEILYSTLCGSLIIGNIAGYMEYPIFGFIFGIIGSIICGLCCKFLKPILSDKLKYFDAMGILYYHGIPALLGSIVTAIRIASLWGKGWEIYDDDDPQTKIELGEYLIPQMRGYQEEGETIGKRKNGGQAGFEILAELVSIFFGVAGGVGAGFLMNLDIWGKVEKDSTDEDFYSEKKDEGNSNQSNESQGNENEGKANQGNSEAAPSNAEKEEKKEEDNKEKLLSENI
ncbi:MAG: ammonium transporter [archaeon]|nr:ammonium transporter [archaeon]